MPSPHVLLLTVVFSLGANGVHAQSIRPRPISVGDRSFNTIGEEHIGLADCDDDVTILFELDSVPDRGFIDLWEGQRCNETTARQADQDDCVWLKSVEIVASDGLEVEITVQELSGGGCSSDDVKTLWFLAVDDNNSTEDPGDGYASWELTLDFTPPRAPDDVKGGSGERQIPVSWDLPSGDDLDGFVVYIDNDPQGDTTGGQGDGGSAGPADCASSLISEGMDARDVPDEIELVRVNSSSATGPDLAPGDVVGEVAAVSVSAVDKAGNESPLSNIACLYLVPTEGFWERYQANGGDVHSGCPCSAPGAVHAREAWPVALALLALAFRRRLR
jgi:hypothetical protein